jgi:hypothetical protein
MSCNKKNPPNCYHQLLCNKVKVLVDFDHKQDCDGCDWNMSPEQVHELVKSLNNMVNIREQDNT